MQINTWLKGSFCGVMGLLLWSCSKEPVIDNTGTTTPGQTISTSYLNIRTDKAVYKPTETIQFTVDGNVPPTARVRYKQLTSVVDEAAITGNTWSWKAPGTDFTGYMVEVYGQESGQEKLYGTVAVDVSSDWSRFPRYGFLSKFGPLQEADMDGVMATLTRYHMNGLQFYDWAEKHHKPLAGMVSMPATSWFDIANRPTSKATVDGYIKRAHQKAMFALSYNLAYGALRDAEADGVKTEWSMYDDQSHVKRTVLDIGSFLKSPIYLMDPANTNWQQYLAARNSDMYSVYSFDGFHIDQLGDWGTKYSYSGQPLNVAGSFGPFIQSMKAAHPDKRLVMNAVNQYGQQASIAHSPVDFLYTEVWSPNERYEDLGRIIQDNDAFGNGSKRTVLAAYMDYKAAEQPGYFNPAGVLLTDAVIFAFGGSHLELGEHMLGKEYFPNANLAMSDELKTSLIRYYDFLVAYQNLLRDGGTFNKPALLSANPQISLANWPSQAGQLAVLGKEMKNQQILHLLNFTNTKTLDWRDAEGTKPKPDRIDKLDLVFTAPKAVKHIWFASPDWQGGRSQSIPFHQTGQRVTFTLPSLHYWDMVVITY
ncbi:glycoside hydrolase family 66 protein [Spirosoma panaciterrae]|uniref:glycoside hydrolase family 66 protein n=1 Tax=Spirosoma panaciterrae TaxID=496058 RepID=UPI0012FAAF13|nr:glycoside hydrolase family 66 protein [Spirosoma panaciterrae]